MSNKGTLRVIRVILLVLLVGFFLPCFAVSCSTQTVDIKPVEAVFGYQNGLGDTVSEPQPILLLFLAIPIYLFIATFFKQVSNKGKGISIFIGGVIELVMWFAFQSKVSKLAQENYCEFSRRYGFTVNVASVICLLILAVVLFAGDGMLTLGAKDKPSMWVCKSCQSSNAMVNAFCSNCGAQKPGPITCSCGTVNACDGVYCKKCGSRL